MLFLLFPFFCNQNLRSPLASYHGSDSLHWHTYFFGEGQIWSHCSSGKPNSHLLPPRSLGTPEEHKMHSTVIQIFLKETKSPMMPETPLLPLFIDHLVIHGARKSRESEQDLPSSGSRGSDPCRAAFLSWEALLELEH